MFPNKKTKLNTKKNKPVTIKQKDANMAGMENFINDELKILQNMKKKKDKSNSKTKSTSHKK